MEMLLRSSLLFIVVNIYSTILINISVLVSSLSKTSGNSIIFLLLVWSIISIIIPKISPSIATIIYPVESERYIKNEINLTIENLNKEQEEEEEEETKILFSKYGFGDNMLDELVNNSSYQAIKNELDQKNINCTQQLSSKKEYRYTKDKNKS